MSSTGFIKVKVCEKQIHDELKNSKQLGKIRFVPIEKMDDADFSIDHVIILRYFHMSN